MAEKGVELTYDDSLIEYLVKNSYSVTYGARNLRRVIQKQIEDVLAQRIVDSRGTEIKEIRLTEEDGKIKVEF